MKKKRLLTLFMAGVLAASSPVAAYAAEFSDSTPSQEITVPGQALSEAENNDALASAEDTAEPEELFQSATPEGDVETFSSEQTPAQTEAADAEGTGFETLRNYIDQDGVTYYYMEDKDSYLVESIFNSDGKTIVIPAEIDAKKVTEIGSNVYAPTFEGQDEYTILTGDLILPEGLLAIRSRAFISSDVISLKIPDSVTEMGGQVFSGSRLRWLHFPAGIPVFQAGLFDQCTRLETIEIPEGVTELASGALKECPNLKNLYLPASMTKIGEDLFAPNAQVTIYGTAGSWAETYAKEHNLAFSTGQGTEPAPNEETVLLDNIYYTYQKSTDSYLATDYTGNISAEITIPETINGKPVSGIGEKAFSYCYRLNRVTLPSTIKSIDSNAFSQCLGLGEINLPEGLKSIGTSAFEECGFKNISIPDSVTSLGEKMFRGCLNLEEVRLPKNITGIPDYMFYQARFTRPFTLPSGIKTIGRNAFGETFGADLHITLPASLTSIGDQAFIDSTITSITIPSSVTKMGQRVFESCRWLCTVNWGKGVKTIPYGTFRYCSALEEMRLPETVTSIGKYAYNNSSIRMLSIPKSVKKIDKTAFGSCKDLTLFVKKGSYGETFAKANKIPYDNGSITNAIVKQNGIRYQYHSAAKTYSVLSADENLEGDIVIPNTINSKK